MTIVYQIGNSLITKDLVFGWVIVNDKSFLAISSCDDTALLQELAASGLPVYLDDFKTAINNRIADLKAREEYRLAVEEIRHQRDETTKAEADCNLIAAAKKRLAFEHSVFTLGSLIAYDLQQSDKSLLSNGSHHAYASVSMKVVDGSVVYVVTGLSHNKVVGEYDSIYKAAERVARIWW